jgi:iron complex transport system substrate-binding protein
VGLAIAALAALAAMPAGAVGLQAPAVPARIVSLVPAITEILFAIGAGAQVVGVSSFDRVPPEVSTRTRVGALLNPDIEGILRLQPDLVIVYASQDDLRQQLARASIPVYDYRHGGLSQVTATIRAIGLRTGHGPEADGVASGIEARLAAVRERVAGRPRPRVLLVFDREAGSLRGIYASGGEGFLHDMLEVAGGENVMGDVARESVQATPELILARQPEVILEVRAAGLGAGLDSPADGAWQRLPSVPAVRAKRINVLEGDEFVVPGPRVADAVARIAGLLHPR